MVRSRFRMLELGCSSDCFTVIPKSVTPERIIANKTTVDLSPEEVQKLFDIEKEGSRRVCKPFWTGYGDIGFEDCKQ